MEKITKHCFSLWLSKLSRMSVVSLGFISSLNFGISVSFLMLLVLIPSTLILSTFTKKKVDLIQSFVKNQLILISGQDDLFLEKLQPFSKETDAKLEIFPENYEAGFPVELYSDSESSNDPFENGEFGSNPWMDLDNEAQNLEFSEDSSSEDYDDDDDDDDSLIEISLPNPTDKKRESIHNNDVHPYLPDFWSDSMLRKQDLVEFLAEINEEDNLIEIDISKGFSCKI